MAATIVKNTKLDTKPDKYNIGNIFYQDNYSDMDKYVDNSVNGCELLDNSTMDVLEKNTIENTKNDKCKTIFIKFLKKYHL